MVNYHRHSDVTNIVLPDSVATNEDYAKRAVELGHTVISSCEHGNPGKYRECAELAEKYNLHWRYVAEVYFVKDRHEKDKTNAHMILAAKTEKGIGDINEILSEANTSGFYFRPRIDMSLLLSLDPKDVFVTTACIGGIWQYGVVYDEETKKKTNKFRFDEPDRLVSVIHSHFGDSFMLEVQYNNTEQQKEINKHILSLYRSKGIQFICGLDSHYINEDEAILRTQFLESKHLHYQDEDGWYMDYPDDETTIRRFKEQGVLSMSQIKSAMDATDVFLTFEDVKFDKSKKLPTIYPSLTQYERNEKYRELICSRWEQYKKNVPQERWKEYEDGIEYEVETITSTNTSDYFLLDYEIIKRFKDLGGRLTYTGRGSAPSYFTNTLLGFSSIDRFSMPITMYPDRFISADRLKAGSTPDIDMNVADPDIFAKAQADVIGPYHSAPMIAFGTMKRLSSWKMYCRASGISIDVANEISDKLKKYELDLKHADDDEKETINPYDYVPKNLHEQLRMSEKYLGMIDSISPHPCAYMVCNADIRREFGLIRLKGDVIAAFIDGATADRYGYLKNDDLKVSVVELIADTYKRIGIPQPTVPDLMKMVEDDKATWDMYAKGFTIGLNQAEKEKSTQKVMMYKPKNISEIVAFCAGIRPGFASMAPKMFGRQRFSYGIPVLDNMLKTKEMPDSFILYQQQVMQILQYGGFAPSESYAAIKAIAKKHPEKVLPLKERFVTNFSNRLIDESGLTNDQASSTTAMVWKIIEDNTSYSFNASHACCVALDSLYIAWAKAHFPYETYAALLSIYAKDGDKDRIDLAKTEMKKAFGITIVPCKFRQDNRSFFIDKEHKTISDSLTSIKGIGMKDALALYKMADGFFPTFIDLLVELTNIKSAVNAQVVETLIKLDYFEEFGSAGKLLKVYRQFSDGQNKYVKTLVKATVQKRLAALYNIEINLPEEEIPPEELIPFEVIKFGTPFHRYPDRKQQYAVLNIDDKYSPRLKLYSLATGNVGEMKTKKSMLMDQPLNVGDIITIFSWQKKQSRKFIDGKSTVIPNQYDFWINSFAPITTHEEMK